MPPIWQPFRNHVSTALRTPVTIANAGIVSSGRKKFLKAPFLAKNEAIIAVNILRTP